MYIGKTSRSFPVWLCFALEQEFVCVCPVAGGLADQEVGKQDFEFGPILICVTAAWT